MTWLHDIIISDHIKDGEKLSLISECLVNFSNPKDEVNKVDDNGFSPLFITHVLTQFGHPLKEIIAFLEGKGASFNARDVIADKKLKNRPLFDIGTCLDPEPIEKYTGSKKPTHLTIASSLPLSNSVLHRVNLEDFEKEFGKQWVTSYMIPRGIKSIASLRVSPEFATTTYATEKKPLDVTKTLAEPYDNFVIVDMGKFGKGLFAGKGGVPAGVGFFYGALLQSPSQNPDYANSKEYMSTLLLRPEDTQGSDDQITSLLNKGNAFLNRTKYFNFMSIMQHLITKKELNQLSFKFPEMKSTIATESVSGTPCMYGDQMETLMQTSEDHPEFTIIGHYFGPEYHRSKDKVPPIFDRRGRYISPVFYKNREIWCRFAILDRKPNALTAAFNITTNDAIAEAVKLQGDRSDYEIPDKNGDIFTVKKQWLIDQDIIPSKPDFLNNNVGWQQMPVEIEKKVLKVKFLLAAAMGDFNTIRYLLEWNLPRVDINAKNDIAGDTALHYAAFNGHYYTVLYLLLQGAALGMTNDAGKTASQCTQDTEVKQLIKKYAFWLVDSVRKLSIEFRKSNQPATASGFSREKSPAELLDRLSIHREANVRTPNDVQPDEKEQDFSQSKRSM